MNTTIIEWLEELWGINCYEVAVRQGQETLHPANYTYFLQGAQTVTVIGVIAVAALLLLIARRLTRGNK